MDKTLFTDVYEYALSEMDDIRLIRLDETNPALYLYRLWSYMQTSIPYVSSPKGIQERLSDYVKPILNQFTFVGDGATTVFTVSQGADCLTVSDKDGEIIATIIPSVSTAENGITYDPTAGTVTFDTAPANETTFNVDLYTDGYFNVGLNVYEMNILGIAFRYVWFSKISNTFLRNTPKIKDKNFNMDSSWGVEQVDTARKKAMWNELHDAMANYEHLIAYSATVPTTNQLMHQASIYALIHRVQG